MLLRLALDTAGLQYEIREIADGRSALQSLTQATGTPDMIITDFIVPGMDFEKLLAALQQVKSLMGVPVVVMSGMKDSKLARSIQERGVAAYIVKPAHLDDWWKIGAQLKQILEKSKGAGSGVV